MERAMTEYFHFSKKKWPVGQILSGSGKPHVDREVERKIQATRPQGKLLRDDAFYLVTKPDFTRLGLSGCGYIHKVKPLEAVQTHDAFWLGQLQAKHLLAKVRARANNANLDERVAAAAVKIDLTCKEICQKYWSGESSEKYWAGSPTWEVLTSRVEVIGYLSPDAVCVQDTKDGWRERPKG
jgi:hypothetical protein